MDFNGIALSAGLVSVSVSASSSEQNRVLISLNKPFVRVLVLSQLLRPFLLLDLVGIIAFDDTNDNSTNTNSSTSNNDDDDEYVILL